ncbi:ankyrin repeat-containing domain protein [Podospora aff. communis PSN243]|uniref:Ankyrin repeat-containing domain protein n=1 Tax=Podospora aff. communis PSN243 TaxID=3040156 RepID=A0AAV9GV40_9PEZI|nr:ankyrin repeat-containing domain protein [Podospora aff. communis PSN243]
MERSLTPLHRAAIGGKRKVLLPLLKKGRADLMKADWGGRTPLHVAVIEGHFAATETLLPFDAPLSSLDSQGCTPLALAAKQHPGHRAIFDLLLSHGASESVSSINRDGRRSYISPALGGMKDTAGHVGVAKLLLDRGANVNGHAGERRYSITTPLELAVERRDLTMVELLLGRGADLSDRARDTAAANGILEEILRRLHQMKHGTRNDGSGRRE